MMISWKDVVGKRVLIREKYAKPKIREVYVVELSPSEKYAKIRYGWVEEWVDTENYMILEVLC